MKPLRLRITSALIAAVFLFSSAPKKEAVKPTPPPAEEKLVPPGPTLPPKAEAKKPEPVRVEEGKEEKFIILNFDGADIETVIATFGELLEMNYILSPGISGRVTIQSYKKFPMKDLPRIFQTILEINGLTAVKDGPLYRIVPIDTAKQQPLDIAEGKGFAVRLDESFVTQIVPVEFLKASEAANILRPLMPRGADLIVYEPANILIVTALPHTLVKVMKIIEAIDISGAERETLRTFVYYVENGEAKKLAEILNKMYTEKKTTVKAAPSPVPARPGAPVPVTGELPGEIGEITINAYEDINAIIIQCSPRSYLSLLEVMKKIDIPVKQVLIEVLIAEVSLKGDLEFGLSWFIKSKSGDIWGLNWGLKPGEEGVAEPGTSPGGGAFAAVVSGSITSNLYDLVFKAVEGISKFNVLASPYILATDNKEANIHIGSEVPLVKSVTAATPTSGVTANVEYKTVGTILTVKPHITEKGRVTLEVTQEVSGLGSEAVFIAEQKYSSIDTRKARTTAVVQSGHTLILGGLIREEKSRARTGLPFLSRIPLLGYLFGSTTDAVRRNELLVMVTPYVISNQDEADALTKDFQEKVKTIKKRLEEDKKKEETPEKEAPDKAAAKEK